VVLPELSVMSASGVAFSAIGLSSGVSVTSEFSDESEESSVTIGILQTSFFESEDFLIFFLVSVVSAFVLEEFVIFTGIKIHDKIRQVITSVVITFPLFARHGRALTGVSPEHAQVVGNV